MVAYRTRDGAGWRLKSAALVIGTLGLAAACGSGSSSPKDAGGQGAEGGNEDAKGGANADGKGAATPGGTSAEAGNSNDTTPGGAGPSPDPDEGVTGELTPELLGNCHIMFPNAWITHDGTRLFGDCSNGLGTLAISDGQVTAVAPTLGNVLSIDADSVIYLDRQVLLRAELAGGAEPTPLSLEAALTPPPQFAAGGKRVVYAADSQTGKANTLLSSPIEGGEATLLFTHDMSFPHVYVAPGGDRVLAMAGLGLYSVAIEGGEPIDMGRLAVTYNNLNSDLVFSPDGNHVAYITYDPQTSGGEMVAYGPIDAKPTVFERRLETGGGGAQEILFTPAGNDIIVHWRASQHPMPNQFVDRVPTDGSEATQLLNADKMNFHGLVGAARDAVLAQTQTGEVSPELVIVDAAGGEPTILSKLDKCVVGSSAKNGAAAVSPDRTLAVYPDALGDLILADLEARTTERLVSKATLVGGQCTGFPPQWSPDSTKIAYKHCPPEGIDCQIRVITTAGEPLATLAGTASHLGGVFFSPDSKRLVSSDTSRGEVFTFTSKGVARATVKAPVATYNLSNSYPIASNFTPATFPWIDNTRFLVEIDSGTAIVDAAP